MKPPSQKPEKQGRAAPARAIRDLFSDALRTSAELFKIIVPISILTRFLQQWGVVDLIGVWLAPLMKLVGLPGPLGLVWATALVTNIYGALVVFAAVAPGLELTVAQVTILGSIILVAHGLPVELRIAQKAGTRFRAMAVLRIGGALLLGGMLNLIYQWSGTLQQPNRALWSPPAVDSTWSAWLLAELRTMLVIFLIILALLVLLRLMNRLGISDLMTRLLKPLLTLLGMRAEAAPLTIIGMTLGISYGGGLIIQEARSGRLNEQDVFMSMSLMGLCHSIFEDTLVLMVIGAHVSGIFWGRLLFSLLVIYLLARLVQRLPATVMRRYLVRAAPLQGVDERSEVGCC